MCRCPCSCVRVVDDVCGRVRVRVCSPATTACYDDNGDARSVVIPLEADKQLDNVDGIESFSAVDVVFEERGEHNLQYVNQVRRHGGELMMREGL
jgi:hypothetical protein